MNKLVFLWDNFGPLHADRCDAVASRFEGKSVVIGIEIASQSKIYEWDSAQGTRFKKITLVTDRSVQEIPFLERCLKILHSCMSMGRKASFFLCHYNDPAIFIVASVLRLLGRRVYTMGCSKYDDYQRYLYREVAKAFLYLPYNGGIASGLRSRDYMRFMGLAPRQVESPYNAVSLDRIRNLAGTLPAPGGVPFRERHFTIVARLVAKKNLSMALSALALYAKRVNDPRPMHIFGTGPLETELRKQTDVDGIAQLVHFRGFLQTAEVSKAYGHSLALLLPSIEEQFGNVVPEAMAMGLPVILSERCGAHDLLVRTGVNGFVVEPDNPIGMALFMQMLSEDEALWQDMCISAQECAKKADSARFAEAVDALIPATGR